MSKLSCWEERIANDPLPNAALTMLLSDWRAERQAWIEKFKSLHEFHEAQLQVETTARRFHYHQVRWDFTNEIIKALVSENIYLLQGE